MNASEIKDLIELVSRSEFSEFELERDGFKLKLVRRVVAADQPGPLVAQAPTSSSPGAPAAAESDTSPVDDSLHIVSSPIVGTYYSASNPESAPFVALGDRVSRGQVLCIVEAMKVMNEIEADADGELVEIAVENGQPVEFGDPLFRIRTG